ncbi:recombinase family protein [Candidatus Vondammii sp. HM_W22]|uniref:recombinase family protein n=1 Tax=Candidatus Vondammii sp. HM_W22 TaxID=2687299 RepID=UPI00403DEE5D
MVVIDMTQRVCIYARYSSDLQSDASIDDQIRLCSEKAKSEDWKVGNCYTDAGIYIRFIPHAPRHSRLAKRCNKRRIRYIAGRSS